MANDLRRRVGGGFKREARKRKGHERRGKGPKEMGWGCGESLAWQGGESCQLSCKGHLSPVAH